MASPTNIRAPRMGAGDLAGTAAAFELRIPSEAIRRLAIGWLALGIAALLGAGLFSILLVLARTPAIAAHLPGVEFFRVALVTHVDLSVLVWFASFAGVLWTIGGPANRTRVGWGALALAAIGTLAMAVAPFIGNGRPIMANYIPVLDTPMFLGGLALFAIAFMAMAARALVHTDGLEQSRQPLRIGLDATALAAIAAGIALVWSWVGVPNDLPSVAYFEMLFWGPGHVLQFVWTLVMLVAWVWLADRGGIGDALQSRMVALAFVVALLPVLAVPIIYLAWPVTSIDAPKAVGRCFS